MESTGIKSLFNETFLGPEGHYSWFAEATPNSGLFGTIESLTADEASVPVNGVTIAAHTDHTRYHVWANNQLLAGKTEDLDWSESWKIGAVTEDEWKQIVEGLHQEYTNLIGHIDKHDDLSSETANTLMGALAHAVYHLGAIRQMVKAIK